MALYLGGNKVKINLGDTACKMDVISILAIIKENLLSSSDNYILRSADEMYLSPLTEKGEN